jgi:hypothetical protein
MNGAIYCATCAYVALIITARGSITQLYLCRGLMVDVVEDEHEPAGQCAAQLLESSPSQHHPLAITLF